MSTDATQTDTSAPPPAAPTTRDLTEDDRKLAFSFLRYVQTLSIDKDHTEAILHFVEEAFGIDVAGVGGKHDTEVDLPATFAAAAKEKTANADDEKFNSFLSVLEKKGYFKDAEPGSDVYKDRVSKARVKFEARNNPYEGLSVDQLKAKGNELMSQNKYKEAIGYYTKAIELDSQNYICYANRAAAHLHLNDYAVAVIDCEKSIAINDKYAKAYARMGTAFFYDQKYQQAVQAFTYATKLEPENDTYKDDLKRANEKLSVAAPGGGAGGGGGGGFPGFPGGLPGMGPNGPDFSQMMEMMKNPQFTGMMEKMMSNPNMASMAQNMAKNMFGNSGGMPPMPGEGNQPQVDANGNMQTPFGNMNTAKLEKMREENASNPKMQQIMEEVRTNGMSAFYNHMGDPEVMELMGKFNAEMFGGGGGDSS